MRSVSTLHHTDGENTESIESNTPLGAVIIGWYRRRQTEYLHLHTVGKYNTEQRTIRQTQNIHIVQIR